MLERSATKTTDGQLVGEGSTSALAALTVMLCMQAWVTTWGGYFGLDITGQLTDIRALMKELCAALVSSKPTIRERALAPGYSYALRLGALGRMRPLCCSVAF